MMLMLLCIMAGIAYKEEKPWSNVSTFWNRFVVLKTISEAEALKWSIAHPPRIDFPSTIIRFPTRGVQGHPPKDHMT